MRLNKYLSDSGFCSRRQADRMVEEGRVTIDGEVAVMGQQVEEGQIVCVDGQEVKAGSKKIILAFNKPKGIVCTTEKREKDNIIDYIKYPERIYPVGRLDKDSEGLILLTNDGEMMNEILRARNYHDKEYEVVVNRPITANFITQMSEGVAILDTITRPCVVKQTGVCSFRIILTQGLNRQIRRMCEALGYRVRDLKRYRIMNIHLGDLPVGQYRELTAREYAELQRQTGLGQKTYADKVEKKQEKVKSGFRDRNNYGKKANSGFSNKNNFGRKVEEKLSDTRLGKRVENRFGQKPDKRSNENKFGQKPDKRFNEDKSSRKPARKEFHRNDKKR